MNVVDAVTSWFDVNAVNLLNGVARGMLLFMIASGLSLIFGLMDVLNLAHGALFAVGVYLAYQFAADGSGVGFVVALVVCCGAAAVLGLALDLSLRPIKGQGHAAEVLVTLGLLYIVGDIISTVWGNEFRSVRPPAVLSGATDILGVTFPKYRLAVIAVGAVLAVALWLVFERTTIGAIVRATVADRDMVGAVGINTTLVRSGVFVVGALLAILGGVLAAPVVSVSPSIANEFLLLGFIVLVIGGPGSLVGALVGALVIGQVQSTAIALIPDYAGFLLFGTMALILVIRPQGLFGRAP